ncbi:MAG: cob(I)yrinic acid a,c-diamide adenosyltransferase [Acidobacteria bacterium]|nr:cob(I)yrinic acid a,c-diamide adenosyltransferase [Acidobacteriota bacterium]MYF76448.1 cob(I)yrinic acid a,c-diamide adenosyltransferase [Acidobacteriota bacterium]MYG74681.1 cob(I)yrinic acid a,c-diamide adenosyltransferase [Acidobacteriota bacterium]
MDEAITHRERMRSLQSEVRRKRAAASDPGRGLVLVHTGDGKGKSSSAFGVIARGLGWGWKVAVVQFIKGEWKTGERQFFERFPDQVVWRTMGEGFTWDTQDRARDGEVAAGALATARGMLASGDFDLVVLDEINVVMSYDYLDTRAVVEALQARAPSTNVILTGRGARREVIDYADLVTEMREVKHPFAEGIRAQRGIDY